MAFKRLIVCVRVCVSMRLCARVCVCVYRIFIGATASRCWTLPEIVVVVDLFLFYSFCYLVHVACKIIVTLRDNCCLFFMGFLIILAAIYLGILLLFYSRINVKSTVAN